MTLTTLFLLNACNPSGDLAPAAIAACEAIPGLGADAVTEAWTRELMDPEEWRIWREEPDPRGLTEMGLESLGVIRGNSRCELDTITGQTAHLTRYEPDFAAAIDDEMESWSGLPAAARSVTLEGIETPDGLRIRAGVAEARADAEAARARAAAGEFEGAEAEFEGIYTRFPDPSIQWELRALDRDRRDRDAALALQVELGEDGVRVRYESSDVLLRGAVVLECAEGARRVELPALGLIADILLDWPEGVTPESCAVRETSAEVEP